MSLITCNINLFDFEQSVFMHADDGSMTELGKAPIQSLDHFIVTMCNEHDIQTIKLSGLQHYTLPLKDRIEREAVARYSKKLDVEVI